MHRSSRTFGAWFSTPWLLLLALALGIWSQAAQAVSTDSADTLGPGDSIRITN